MCNSHGLEHSSETFRSACSLVSGLLSRKRQIGPPKLRYQKYTQLLDGFIHGVLEAMTGTNGLVVWLELSL